LTQYLWFRRSLYQSLHLLLTKGLLSPFLILRLPGTERGILSLSQRSETLTTKARTFALFSTSCRLYVPGKVGNFSPLEDWRSWFPNQTVPGKIMKPSTFLSSSVIPFLVFAAPEPEPEPESFAEPLAFPEPQFNPVAALIPLIGGAFLLGALGAFEGYKENGQRCSCPNVSQRCEGTVVSKSMIRTS
jgi:hypothetical protein